jgi:hypothetical protein
MAASTIDLSRITTIETGLVTDHMLEVESAANKIAQQMERERGRIQPSTENQRGEEHRGLAVLSLKEDDFKMCQNELYKPFFWYSNILSIDLCYMKQLGYKSSEMGKSVFSEQGGAVYNTTKYDEATWSFDLDFDGSPETIRASLRNSEMALTVTSKTSERINRPKYRVCWFA